MERFLKGLTVVLLLCAVVWLLVRATHKAEMTPITAVPVQTVTPMASKPVQIQEGERAASAIPPIKLIREKRTVKRTEPPVPLPGNRK